MVVAALEEVEMAEEVTAVECLGAVQVAEEVQMGATEEVLLVEAVEKLVAGVSVEVATEEVALAMADREVVGSADSPDMGKEVEWVVP